MSDVTFHLPLVMYHISGVTCHKFFFFRKWLSLFLEGLVSMEPTPSSFWTFSYKKYADTQNLLILACSGPFLVIKKQIDEN